MHCEQKSSNNAFNSRVQVDLIDIVNKVKVLMNLNLL